MDESEEIDDFAAMFSAGFGSTQEKIEVRAKKERRSNLSERQRSRGAIRTAQLNFRCSPEFKARTAALSAHLDCSVADMFEMAVEALAKARKFQGGK